MEEDHLGVRLDQAMFGDLPLLDGTYCTESEYEREHCLYLCKAVVFFYLAGIGGTPRCTEYCTNMNP